MRRVAGYLLVSVIAALGFGSARADARLVEEQNGGLFVEVRFDQTPSPASERGLSVLLTPGLPALRYERFYVAVPSSGVVRVGQLGGESVDHRGDLPEIVVGGGAAGGIPAESPGTGLFPAAPVIASKPFVFRNTRVVAVDCFASQVDYQTGVERRWSRYRVQVMYDGQASVVDPSRADPLVSGMVINGSSLPVPAARRNGRVREAGGAGKPGLVDVPDPHFSLSSNWIKITVDSAGVYAIDGSDLARIGVALNSIHDPTSFRLFTHGGRELERRDLSEMPFTDPDGTWRPGKWMTECDILVELGDPLTFGPTDRIIFYAVGVQGWKDLYEPGAPRHEYHDHLYTKENYYYLTWDAPGFPGQPSRMTPVAAAPLMSEPDLGEFEERVYFERNLVPAFTYGGDGWRWLSIDGINKTGPETVTFPGFQVEDLVPARSQRFRTLALAPWKDGADNTNHHAVYLMNSVEIGDVVFSVASSGRTFDSAVTVELAGTFLQEGTNILKLRVPRDLRSEDFMYFELYEIFYSRLLRARGDRLLFSSPDTTGTVNFRVSNFTSGQPVYLFDVSDPFRPRRLTGYDQTEVGGRIQARFSYSIGDDATYFFAVSSNAFETPLRLTRHAPRDLRDVTTAPHMLVVCHPPLRSSALQFKSYRESRYPYSYTPDIEVVTTNEVFDNFSGGLVDPMAIRNYCKFLFDNFTDDQGYPRLTFLVLFGDANMDFKNYTTSQPNMLTTNLNLRPTSADAYTTDDWYAELEPPVFDPPDTTGPSFPQIAVGRLPANSSSDASFLVNRIVDYETEADFGPWRDRVILVADDERTPNHPPQPMFVAQSEWIAHGVMAPFLEPVKIYLTEYPLIGGIKEASRIDFIEEWNSGGLVINYIGHGSSESMADEQVFLGTDVSRLENGLRLPLFVAFSCTIGDFARAQSICLAEKLLLWEKGGAIAAITASEVSFIDPNAFLDNALFGEFTPGQPGGPEPLGVALMRAKTDVMSVLVGSRAFRLVEENNQKYNLLGDPSLRLASPRRSIVFNPGDLDTLTAGKRANVRGTVYKGSSPDTGFNGTVHLVLREPDDTDGYTSEDSLTFIPYRYPGGTIYRGRAEVASGSFEFNVKLPRIVPKGPLAFARAYADNGNTDAVALDDGVYIAAAPPGDPEVITPLDGSPRVEMRFEGSAGGQAIVKPGAVLVAPIHDADGINILNTTPQGKLVLLFSSNNIPRDVTSFFEYDNVGTDTSGVLRFDELPRDMGRNRAILKVSDSFGQVTQDTLVFTMTDPVNYVAEVVLNYPNPFATSTYFLLNLTDPAEVQLDIFTVSGKKIRTLREREGPGEAWILWDGRDSVGDPIANGTYLYVARVSFVGLDRPPVILRGKVAKIE